MTKCHIWSKISIILAAGLVVALFANGCLLSPANMYMAEYEVRTPAAKEAAFQDEFNKLGNSIAISLNRNYEEDMENQGYFVSALLRPKTYNKSHWEPNVDMEWYRREGLVIVGITTEGPDESPDVTVIRKQIESILNSKAYKWQFSVQHRRTIFY